MLRITLILFLTVICSVLCYTIPKPKFQLLKPYGFRAYIPDEDGIKLFAFHANLEKPLEYNSIGQMSADVIAKTNGKWVYENKTAKINYGDKLYYWIFVIKSGEGYRLDESVHVFDDMQVKRLKKKMGHLRRKRHSYSDYSGDEYPNYYYNNKKKYPGFYPGYYFSTESNNPQSSEENTYQPYGFYDNYFKNHHHHHHHQHKFDNCHYPHKHDRKTTTKQPTTKVTTVATTTTTETSTFPNIDVRFGENQ